jgi:glutamine synthetase
MGFDHFYVGPELEFFYFKNSDGTEVLDKGGYFDLTPLDVASDLRRDTVMALEEMGIDVEYSHHEVGPSQHEIDIRYRRSQDRRRCYDFTAQVKIANVLRHASFMLKLFGERQRHAHAPVTVQGDDNAFFDGGVILFL